MCFHVLTKILFSILKLFGQDNGYTLDTVILSVLTGGLWSTSILPVKLQHQWLFWVCNIYDLVCHISSCSYDIGSTLHTQNLYTSYITSHWSIIFAVPASSIQQMLLVLASFSKKTLPYLGLTEMCSHFVVTFSISTLAGHNDYVTCGPNYIYNYSQIDYDGLLSYLPQCL